MCKKKYPILFKYIYIFVNNQSVLILYGIFSLNDNDNVRNNNKIDKVTHNLQSIQI